MNQRFTSFFTKNTCATKTTRAGARFVPCSAEFATPSGYAKQAEPVTMNGLSQGLSPTGDVAANMYMTSEEFRKVTREDLNKICKKYGILQP
jgi:hypothetical protein